MCRRTGRDVQLKPFHLNYTSHTWSNLWRVLTIDWSLSLEIYCAVKECRPERGSLVCRQSHYIIPFMDWLNSDFKVVNMFYAQMFSHEAFSSKLLPQCLEVLQSFIKISLHSFVLGNTSRFCMGHCANQQVHRDLAWTACNIEVAGTWPFFFYWVSRRQPTAELRSLKKKKQQPFNFYFFLNEMEALWLFNKVDLLSKVLSPLGRWLLVWKWPSRDPSTFLRSDSSSWQSWKCSLDWVICCSQKKCLSVIYLRQSFCLFILTI